MGIAVFPISSKVRVTNYGPWRGLLGTIMAIHMITYPGDEPFCFYLVAVEGAHVKEPIWFDYTEVELITSPLVDTLFVEMERLEGRDQKGGT